MRGKRELGKTDERNPADTDHEEADQQMKSDISEQTFPFNGKAEREPNHSREKQQPKRPKRRSETEGLPP